MTSTVEIVTIPVADLQGIIADAVARGIQKAKDSEVVEDTYINTTKARLMIGCKDNRAVVKLCNKGILSHTCVVGKERGDGKASTRKLLISKNSIIKFLKNKR